MPWGTVHGKVFASLLPFVISLFSKLLDSIHVDDDGADINDDGDGDDDDDDDDDDDNADDEDHDSDDDD